MRRATLKMLAPLHLGEHGIGLEATSTFPRSDTLFSALCFAWAAIFGEDSLRALLEAFREGSPPFLISSAFPFYGTIRFYPRPLLRPKLEADAAERVKDTRWVSEGIFKFWLDGVDLSSFAKPDNLKDDMWLLPEEARSLKGGTEVLTLYVRENVARVTIDRVTSASNLYYVGQVRFPRKGGLFCYAASNDEETLEKLREALEYLGEQGIGGERSLGYGRFTLSAWDVVQEWSHEGERFVTLSLYHPTEAEVGAGALGGGAAYRLVRREGFVTSPHWHGPVRRRAVYMLEEGSVVAKTAHKVYGHLVDVTPGALRMVAHRVYRYGFAFPWAVGSGG